MKASLRPALALSLVCAVYTRGAAASVCSSLNGPFCTGFSRDFAVPPGHFTTNLDRSPEELKREEFDRKLRVESVLKQYEVEALGDSNLAEVDRLLNEIDELIEEAAAWLEEELEDDDESPVIGSFAFANSGDTYELLETMDGTKMKKFFELAFEEVLRSWEGTLEDMSPEISQGLRNTVDELKMLEDYGSYRFKHLEETGLARIRQRFLNHRLIEVQRLFERVIVAKSSHGRSLAVESTIFLFQLCDEYAPTATEESSSDSGSADDSDLEQEET